MWENSPNALGRAARHHEDLQMPHCRSLGHNQGGRYQRTEQSDKGAANAVKRRHRAFRQRLVLATMAVHEVLVAALPSSDEAPVGAEVQQAGLSKSGNGKSPGGMLVPGVPTSGAASLTAQEGCHQQPGVQSMEVDGTQTAIRRSARKRKAAAGSSGKAQEGLAAEDSQQAVPEADCQDFNPLQVGSAVFSVPTRALQCTNGQPVHTSTLLHVLHTRTSWFFLCPGCCALLAYASVVPSTPCWTTNNMCTMCAGAELAPQSGPGQHYSGAASPSSGNRAGICPGCRRGGQESAGK